MADRELSSALIRLGASAARGDAGVTDAQLLDRFVGAGDDAAFELLVWRYARLVFGVCRRVLGDVHDTEDAFQAVFLSLARKAGAIGKREALACWLYKVAYRVALTARGVRARRAARERPAALLGGTAAPPEAAPSEGREVQRLVDEEVNRLPERLRAAVILCYLEGKTVAEAARQLDCPRGTVASRLARARQRLSARLTRRGLTLGAGLTGALAAPVMAAHTLIRPAARAAAEYARTTLTTEMTGRAAALAGEVLKAMFIQKLKALVTMAAVAGLLLLSGGLALWGHAGAPAVGQPAPLVRVPVRKPVSREVGPVEDFVGVLETLRGAGVRPRVSGEVKKVHVHAGAVVKKGDVLVELDPAPYKAALAHAEANLARVEARRRELAAEFKRAKKLLKPSQEARDQMQGELKIFEAACKSAREEVDANRQALESTRVVAPTDGQVSERNVSVGDFVSAAGESTLLLTLAPADRIGLRFDMDERSYLRYQKLQRAGEVKGVGTPLSVALAAEDKNGFPYTATLTSFGSAFNPDTGTIQVRGTLPNPGGRLLAGQFVRVRMPFGKSRRVLTVPEAAVGSDNGKHYVLVVNSGDVVERREVKLGQLVVGMRVIAEGLRPEQWVIVRGLERVRLGDRVEPKREEPRRDPAR